MKKVVACALLLSCVALALGQGNQKKPDDAASKPDLSGVWTLDKSQGNFRKVNAALAEGGITLIVSHQEPEIKITRKFILDGKERVQELSYYTDNRGEKNPAMIVNALIESKTKWDGRKLVSRLTTDNLVNSNPAYRMRNIRMDIYTTEKWELSADGQTLTQTTHTTFPRMEVRDAVIYFPARDQTVKKVFRRIS